MFCFKPIRLVVLSFYLFVTPTRIPNIGLFNISSNDWAALNQMTMVKYVNWDRNWIPESCYLDLRNDLYKICFELILLWYNCLSKLRSFQFECHFWKTNLFRNWRMSWGKQNSIACHHEGGCVFSTKAANLIIHRHVASYLDDREINIAKQLRILNYYRFFK